MAALQNMLCDSLTGVRVPSGRPTQWLIFPEENQTVDSNKQESEIRSSSEQYLTGGTYTDIYTHPIGYAVKKLRCVPTDRDYIDKVDSLYKNILVPIWSLFSHDHVVPLLGVHADGRSLQFPYYNKGNIRDHNRRCSDANKLVQITQIAAGISYLHGEGVEHGNICPANILIKDDGGACISDPGFNSLMRQLKYDTHAPVPATWCYKPREELLSDTSMGPKADVYAWASVVYEVFSGKRPYSAYRHTGGIIRIINDGHRTLDRPLAISPKLWNIMQKCWKINPADRPTMPQVESELRELD